MTGTETSGITWDQAQAALPPLVPDHIAGMRGSTRHSPSTRRRTRHGHLLAGFPQLRSRSLFHLRAVRWPRSLRVLGKHLRGFRRTRDLPDRLHILRRNPRPHLRSDRPGSLFFRQGRLRQSQAGLHRRQETCSTKTASANPRPNTTSPRSPLIQQLTTSVSECRCHAGVRPPPRPLSPLPEAGPRRRVEEDGR